MKLQEKAKENQDFGRSGRIVLSPKLRGGNVAFLIVPWEKEGRAGANFKRRRRRARIPKIKAWGGGGEVRFLTSQTSAKGKPESTTHGIVVLTPG